MAINQYGDLPQIYGMEEQGYLVWQADHEYHTPSYKQPITRFMPSNDFSDDSDNAILSLRLMQRFMYDQGPFHPHMLQPNTSPPSPFSKRHAQQWPELDTPRNLSPDRTSASGLSSHASHCERQSPPACYTDLYSSSPTEYSQYLYPDAEPSYSASYLPEVAASSSVVDPKELVIEPWALELEAASEEVGGGKDAAREQERGCNLGLETGQESKGNHDSKTSHNHDANTVKPETTSPGKHYADSAIRYSVRDAESVQPAEEPASDSDYKPSNRSTKRKRSSGSNGSLNRMVKRRTPRRKDSVISSSASSTTRCRRRPNASKFAAKATTSLEHRRPFPCPLAPYGCDSNFVSKNEWKRHVSTQHIKLAFWRCDICAATADPKHEASSYHNDFNRMDLFRQHLRRMHASPKDKPAPLHADYPVNEDNLADHQARCYHKLRTAPQHSSCLFCPKTFGGPASWADRMDHVGSHLEKDRRDGAATLDMANWRSDPGLEQYLLDEGLVEVQGGEWRIGDGRPRRQCAMQREEESEEE